MSRSAVVPISICAIVAAFLAMLKRLALTNSSPQARRRPVLTTPQPAHTHEVVPTPPGDALSPFPRRPAQPRGGRRELLYRPTVCSRVRRVGGSGATRGRPSARSASGCRISVVMLAASASVGKGRARSTCRRQLRRTPRGSR